MVWCSAPVCSLITVMAAAPTAAPEGSVMTPAIEELSDWPSSVAGLTDEMPMSSATSSRRETQGRLTANLVNIERVDLLEADDVACVFDTRASWRERRV